MHGWFPVASHWPVGGADWIVLLLPLYVLSAALAGRWLAERKRRRRHARARAARTEE